MDVLLHPRRALLGAILSAALVVSLPGCRSAPPFVADSPAGTVRAASALEARRTLELLGELRPAVERLLGTGAGVALEVWVRELDPELLTRDGYTERGRDGRMPLIHLQPGAPHVRTTLAHELVHALAAEELRPLPPLLEEGLADWVARQVAPATDLERIARHVHVAAYFGAMLLSLELDAREPDKERVLEIELRLEGERDPLEPEELFSISDRGRWRARIEACGRARAARFYTLAELCVEQVVARRGDDGLRELIERAGRDGHASVPWAWIAEASGLASRRDWLLAAYARLTAADLRLVAESQPGLVIAPLVAVCEQFLDPSASHADAVERLRQAGARLVFASGEFLPLSELEPLVAALAARSMELSRGP